MLDSLVPVLFLARQFSQDVFCAGVGWIDLQFGLKFLAGLLDDVGGSIGLGKKKTADAEVDAGCVGILRQGFLVFLGRLIPLALGFEGFGVQKVRLIGIRSNIRQRDGSVCG